MKKQIEESQKMMKGTTRIKNKKGKGSKFKHRPDRKKNAMRRALALSKSKSDMEVD